MTNIRLMLFAIALFLLSNLSLSQSAISQSTLPELQPTADSKEIAQANPSKPYKMTASVVVTYGPHGKKQEGKITLYRDRDRFRSDIVVGDFWETRIAIADELRLWRSFNEPPVGFSTLGDLDRSWEKTLRDDLGSTKIYGAKIHGIDAECTEVKKTKESRCLESGTKRLLQFSNYSYRIEFFDYMPSGVRQYPQRIVIASGSRTVFEVREIRMEEAPFPSDALQAPAPNPKLFHVTLKQCETTSLARVTKRVEPKYPAEAVLARLSGTVYLYLFINEQGQVQYAGVQWASSPSLASISLEAVKQWQYAPAMCGSTPIANESEIAVQFTIN